MIKIEELGNIIKVREKLSKTDYDKLMAEKELKEIILELRKDKQELWGHIQILEEQQEIMHNFLVEINKYLVKLTEKENGLRVSETKTKGKKANERR